MMSDLLVIGNEDIVNEDIENEDIENEDIENEYAVSPPKSEH